MDDLVDGYSQFTALADEASKGLAVDGVKDPLGRSTTSHVPAAASTTAAAAPVSSPSSRRRRSSSAPSGALFGSGGGEGGSGVSSPPAATAAAVPAFASAATTTGTGTGTGGGGIGGGGGGGGEAALLADPVQDPVARDALKLLFSKEGNYVQVCVLCASACLRRV